MRMPLPVWAEVRPLLTRLVVVDSDVRSDRRRLHNLTDLPRLHRYRTRLTFTRLEDVPIRANLTGQALQFSTHICGYDHVPQLPALTEYV